MKNRSAVSDKRILNLYAKTGSITKVAKTVKRAYYTIWVRLDKLGKL